MTGSGLVLRREDLTELQALARVLVEAHFFPDVASEAQAAAKVIAGRELGLGPMESMRSFHVVEGKVEMSADLLAQRVKDHPAYDYRVRVLNENECEIEFFQDGESLGVSRFDQVDRERAGISLKTAKGYDSTWAKYPRNMLFARAMSNGVAWYCPDVAAGARLYVEGEVGGAEPEDPAPVVIDAATGEVIQKQVTPHDPPWTSEEERDRTAGSGTASSEDTSEGGGLGDRGIPSDGPPPSATASGAGSTGEASRMGKARSGSEGTASEESPEGDASGPAGRSRAPSGAPASVPRAAPTDEPEPSVPTPEGPTPEPEGEPDTARTSGSGARATNTQKKRLAILAGELDMDDEARHLAAGVASFSDLTRADADRLIKVWNDQAKRTHEHVWTTTDKSRKGWKVCAVEGCGLARTEQELNAQGVLA